jgi:hypothetical protein
MRWAPTASEAGLRSRQATPAACHSREPRPPATGGRAFPVMRLTSGTTTSRPSASTAAAAIRRRPSPARRLTVGQPAGPRMPSPESRGGLWNGSWGGWLRKRWASCCRRRPPGVRLELDCGGGQSHELTGGQIHLGQVGDLEGVRPANSASARAGPGRGEGVDRTAAGSPRNTTRRVSGTWPQKAPGRRGIARPLGAPQPTPSAVPPLRPQVGRRRRAGGAPAGFPTAGRLLAGSPSRHRSTAAQAGRPQPSSRRRWANRRDRGEDRRSSQMKVYSVELTPLSPRPERAAFR